MTFSSIIERHFRQIIGWSIVVALASVIITGTLWLLQTREHSKKFILSQVRETAVANINSQNMAAMDGELSRIITTWSSTEMLPVRVDVFVDGRLWAHGGALHPFEQPAITDSYSETLPSGEKLQISVQADVGTPLSKLALAIAIFFAFFTATFCLLYMQIKNSVKAVTSPLASRVHQLEEIADHLEDLTKLSFDAPTTPVNELSALDKSLRKLIGRILKLEGNLGEIHFKKGQVKAAERLSHSLRGIISNFQLILKDGALAINDREAMSSNLRQLIEIGENVLNARKAEDEPNDSMREADSLINVGNVISRLVANMRTETNVGGERQINLEFTDSSHAVPITKGSLGVFEGAIANILSNAVEAVGGKGQITAKLNTTGKSIILKVADDGCGIPAHILPKIAVEEGFTTKEKGNGLGLCHSRTTVEAMGGKFNISSPGGRGAIVIIELPLIADGIKREIVLFPGQTFVVVDDDPAIHRFFKKILEPFLAKIEIVDLFSPKEFQDWILKNNDKNPGARQYIFDYEFSGSDISGLDLVSKHGLVFESIVISGAAHKSELIAGSAALKVPLMSKENLQNLRIKWEGIEQQCEEMIS